jgi:uncharacterized DUF497 family protein
MDFEYDPAKSAANKAKHGIDFEAAQSIWTDPRLLEVPARTVDEPRFLVIGRIDDRHWSAVTTHRAGKVRLISVRWARQQEIEHYESA